jgi:para-nitrobenzyl esterase
VRRFALLLAILAAPAAAQTADVTGGTVRGTNTAGHIMFRGIPFAAPPLAERRWTRPAPVDRWPGVRDAAKPAPACPQHDFGWNHVDAVFSSEDCLTLDVGTAAMTGKRPVLVWIHGGSNTAGSPGGMVESPIVEKGVVVVGVRYRLGVLGFLAHRGFEDAGNFALMDQIAALQWVRDNIARFGGDPALVTIAGESAGAQDVGLLLAAPAARGLFARAILGSGTPGFGLPFRTREEAWRIGDQLDALIGANGDVAALRAASVTALIAAGEKLHDPVLTDDDYRWLRTTIDGRVVPRSPGALLRYAPRRDVLIGSNVFELDLPGGRTRRDAFVATAYGANEARVRAFYRLDHPDPPADPRRGTRDQRIATDATFRCPAGRIAMRMARKGGRVWAYSFDGAPGGGMTSHATELQYIYRDVPLGVLHLQDYWANFVRSGDPNGAGLPTWPAYGRGRLRLALTAAGAMPQRPPANGVCHLSEHL